MSRVLVSSSVTVVVVSFVYTNRVAFFGPKEIDPEEEEEENKEPNQVGANEKKKSTNEEDKEPIQVGADEKKESTNEEDKEEEGSDEDNAEGDVEQDMRRGNLMERHDEEEKEGGVNWARWAIHPPYYYYYYYYVYYVYYVYSTL